MERVARDIRKFIESKPDVNEAIAGDIADEAFDTVMSNLAALNALYDYTAQNSTDPADKQRFSFIARWVEKISDEVEEGPGAQ